MPKDVKSEGQEACSFFAFEKKRSHEDGRDEVEDAEDEGCEIGVEATANRKAVVVDKVLC